MQRDVLAGKDLHELLDVSRETLERLEVYVALLRKWNPRINLVGPQTLGDPWRRHILDSAQLVRLLPSGAGPLVDLGTGAGLPGLVLAILGVEHVHLVELDARKAAFLAEAARLTGATPRIHLARAEALPSFPARLVTARALKPLKELLGYAERFLSTDTACYFHKGERWAAELAEAKQIWHCRETVHPSLSDPAGVILELRDIARERP